jgi:hypothetical protein
MDLDFDESWFLYGTGALLGVISILYFGLELIFDLSPTVKSAVLICSSAAFLLSGELTDSKLLRNSVNLFSGVTYLSFLIYVILRFNPSETSIFGLLAISSVIFTVMGYLRSRKGFELGYENSKKLLTGLGVFLALIIIFDVTGAQPEYKFELKEEVSVNNSKIVLGDFVVENRFPLSRNIELPDYDGCLAYNQTMRDGIWIHFDEEKMIAGGETENYKLKEQVKVRNIGERPLGETIRDNEIITGNYTVKTGKCPERPENMTVYITNSGESTEVYGGIQRGD